MPEPVAYGRSAASTFALMGRYVVVLPLEPLALGDGYPLKTWPLHLTVAPTFVIDNPLQTAVSAIAPVFAFQRPLMLRAGHDEGFGRSETIPVTVVQRTIELELLHERLVRELTAVAAEFDDPHFTGAGYRAHVTMNRTERIHHGDTLHLRQAAIVDMEPDGDERLRNVVWEQHLRLPG